MAARSRVPVWSGVVSCWSRRCSASGSPCGARRGEIRAAKSWWLSCSSYWAGALLAEVLFVALAVSFACWLARANDPPHHLLARANNRLPQDDEQDRCHRARGHDVPCAVARILEGGGSFFASRPGSIPTSVEALNVRTIRSLCTSDAEGAGDMTLALGPAREREQERAIGDCLHIVREPGRGRARSRGGAQSMARARLAG